MPRADGVLAVFVAGLAFNATGTGAERRGEVRVDEGINRFVVIPLFSPSVLPCPGASWRGGDGGVSCW